MLRTAVTLLITAVAVAAVAHRQPSTTVIGVLEQQPQCDEKRAAGVRVLFARRANGWIPLNSRDSIREMDLKSATFQLAFDGRSLGTLNTTDPGLTFEDDWFFRRDHFLDVAPGQKLPQIANRSHRFEGWCDAPHVRPIVAVAAGHVEDPEHWKPFTPTEQLRDSVFGAFKALVGKVTYCKTRGSTDASLVAHYTPRDMQVRAGYQSASGKRIVSLALDSRFNTCDGIVEPEFLGHWFVLDPKPRHIGSEMDLLDAGDYDGDGHSELIFWSSGLDNDGYLLFYDDLNRQARFTWAYH